MPRQQAFVQVEQANHQGGGIGYPGPVWFHLQWDDFHGCADGR